MLRDYTQLPRQVHILCLGTLINRAGSFFIVFLTIYLSKQLGFSVPFATLTIGVSGFGSMIGAIAGGHFADKLGRRVVMLFALFGSAGMLVGLSFVQHPLLFLIGIFLFSVIIDMYRPAASAMVGDLVEPESRQYSFGLLYISVNLGFAIAPPLGGVLSEYSWQLLFWGDAITTSLFAILVLATITETLPTGDGAGDQPAGSTRDDPEYEIGFVEAATRMMADAPFMIFCIATFLSSVVFMQCVSTLPIAMMGLGISASEYGRVVAINGLLIVFLQLPITKWMSRYDRMSVVAVGGLLISLGFGMNAFANSLGHFAMSIVVWTFGEMFQAPFKQAVVSDLAPAELRGRYFGLYSMSYCLALTVGAPLGGAIMEYHGAHTLWSLCFVTGFAAVMLYLGVRPAIQRRVAIVAAEA